MRGIVPYILVLFVGAAAVGVPAYLGKLPGLKRDAGTVTTVSDDPARGDRVGTKPAKIVALARLEPAGGILELAGTPGDRIDVLAVRVGRDVKKNDVLITFASHKLRSLELKAAESQYTDTEKRLKAEQDYADALVNQAQVGQRLLELDDLEYAAQQTRIKSLESQAETAGRNYDRVSKVSTDITSPQQLDQVRLLRDQAANELAAARDQLKKLDTGRQLRKQEMSAKLDEAQAGRRKVDAMVPIESLKIARDVAQEKLLLSELKAPSDGRILEVHCDEGDAVGQLPLIRMGDVSRMVAIAEVYETQVRYVAEGATAEFTSDAVPGKLSGKVEKVGTVVGKNRMYSLDPTRNADLRVIEVRVLLDEESSRKASKYVSLQVNASITPTDAP
jgi:HlyD family secretion protein